MATMPWDKIEGSQTEPLLGRKLLDVRFRSEADIAARLADVRFTPKRTWWVSRTEESYDA
jgi:hypothetical protein